MSFGSFNVSWSSQWPVSALCSSLNVKDWSKVSSEPFKHTTHTAPLHFMLYVNANLRLSHSKKEWWSAAQNAGSLFWWNHFSLPVVAQTTEELLSLCPHRPYCILHVLFSLFSAGFSSPHRPLLSLMDVAEQSADTQSIYEPLFPDAWTCSWWNTKSAFWSFLD